MKNDHFKIADSEDEFEAIHALNYRTFVEEIPQHPPNPEHRLVDVFHDENTYAICIADGHLVGMIAARAQRPFSLERKLDNLDGYLPRHRKPIEIRLLAVEAAYRKSSLCARLVQILAKHFGERGYDLALISGTLRQTRLYRHMGFTAFGPRVGTEQAPYQPMYLDLKSFAGMEKRLMRIQQRNQPMVNLLPGPVAVAPAVEAAIAIPAVYHRSKHFAAMLEQVRHRLLKLVHAEEVFLMQGSGTSANDAIAAQLGVLPGPGLVIGNGEFGDRLLDHARRWRLDHIQYRADWGQSLNIQEILALLSANPGMRWVWMVACETSTGMINPWQDLAAYCRSHDVRFCLDAISLIGAMPVNLNDVYFASGVSGKAIGALPGIALVFYNGPSLSSAHPIPRALDLAQYQQASVPFTLSSNLLAALLAALEHTDWSIKQARILRASSTLREQLQQQGITVLVSGKHAAAAVITIALPTGIDSVVLCASLRRKGYLIGGDSTYLAARNWIQICLFGEFSETAVVRAADEIAEQMKCQRRKA
jgi:aspartate aminotransferase-like enzyme